LANHYVPVHNGSFEAVLEVRAWNFESNSNAIRRVAKGRMFVVLHVNDDDSPNRMSDSAIDENAVGRPGKPRGVLFFDEPPNIDRLDRDRTLDRRQLRSPTEHAGNPLMVPIYELARLESKVARDAFRVPGSTLAKGELDDCGYRHRGNREHRQNSELFHNATLPKVTALAALDGQ